jgi:tRNA-specific 2-thiouridylase
MAGRTRWVVSPVVDRCSRAAPKTMVDVRLHMTNWDEDDAYRTAAEDYQAARRVCNELGVPLHRADFSVTYQQQVFADFLADYAAGRTPNPDVLCNRYIKFGNFLDHARRLGAQRIATGHYAQLETSHGLRYQAADWQKDQTTFCTPSSRLPCRIVFPIGGLTKAQVVAWRTMRVCLTTPSDSTGICFIRKRPFREFLVGISRGHPVRSTPDGAGGRARGLMFYTLVSARSEWRARGGPWSVRRCQRSGPPRACGRAG